MKRVDDASFSGSSGAAPSRRTVPEPRSLSPEADRWRNIPKAETYGHRTHRGESRCTCGPHTIIETERTGVARMIKPGMKQRLLFFELLILLMTVSV